MPITIPAQSLGRSRAPSNVVVRSSSDHKRSFNARMANIATAQPISSAQAAFSDRRLIRSVSVMIIYSLAGKLSLIKSDEFGTVPPNGGTALDDSSTINPAKTLRSAFTIMSPPHLRFCRQALKVKSDYADPLGKLALSRLVQSGAAIG